VGIILDFCPGKAGIGVAGLRLMWLKGIDGRM
jgi:hypothetical protein